MGSWIREERRQGVRYEVTLSAVARHGLMGNSLITASHDISAQGAGLIVDRQLTAGETLEITFIMPDNGEQIHSKGRVVWVDVLGPNRYRAGVVLTEPDLRPIPMVMRSIKVRTGRYYC
ncbi:MAG: PilZ domain-containing protein [Candidatus Omnitrophota bacterium]